MGITQGTSLRQTFFKNHFSNMKNGYRDGVEGMRSYGVDQLGLLHLSSQDILVPRLRTTAKIKRKSGFEDSQDGREGILRGKSLD